MGLTYDTHEGVTLHLTVDDATPGAVTYRYVMTDSFTDEEITAGRMSCDHQVPSLSRALTTLGDRLRRWALAMHPGALDTSDRALFPDDRLLDVIDDWTVWADVADDMQSART